MSLPDDDWMERGECRRHHDPDYWFANSTGGQETYEALTLCRACPVRRECLAYAMNDMTLVGVWGGATWRQRLRWRIKVIAEGGGPEEFERLYQEAAKKPLASPRRGLDDHETVVARRRVTAGLPPHLAEREPVRDARREPR